MNWPKSSLGAAGFGFGSGAFRGAGFAASSRRTTSSKGSASSSGLSAGVGGSGSLDIGRSHVELFAVAEKMKTEVEADITPEMMEAGVSALEDFSESYDSWMLVKQIYRAMISAAPSRDHHADDQDGDY